MLYNSCAIIKVLSFIVNFIASFIAVVIDPLKAHWRAKNHKRRSCEGPGVRTLPKIVLRGSTTYWTLVKYEETLLIFVEMIKNFTQYRPGQKQRAWKWKTINRFPFLGLKMHQRLCRLVVDPVESRSCNLSDCLQSSWHSAFNNNVPRIVFTPRALRS